MRVEAPLATLLMDTTTLFAPDVRAGAVQVMELEVGVPVTVQVLPPTVTPTREAAK